MQRQTWTQNQKSSLLCLRSLPFRSDAVTMPVCGDTEIVTTQLSTGSSTRASPGRSGAEALLVSPSGVKSCNRLKRRAFSAAHLFVAAEVMSLTSPNFTHGDSIEPSKKDLSTRVSRGQLPDFPYIIFSSLPLPLLLINFIRRDNMLGGIQEYSRVISATPSSYHHIPYLV
jgi:hypothetical protein